MAGLRKTQLKSVHPTKFTEEMRADGGGEKKSGSQQLMARKQNKERRGVRSRMNARVHQSQSKKKNGLVKKKEKGGEKARELLMREWVIE